MVGVVQSGLLMLMPSQLLPVVSPTITSAGQSINITNGDSPYRPSESCQLWQCHYIYASCKPDHFKCVPVNKYHRIGRQTYSVNCGNFATTHASCKGNHYGCQSINITLSALTAILVIVATLVVRAILAAYLCCPLLPHRQCINSFNSQGIHSTLLYTASLLSGCSQIETDDHHRNPNTNTEIIWWGTN